jgi:hypothetical protein
MSKSSRLPLPVGSSSPGGFLEGLYAAITARVISAIMFFMYFFLLIGETGRRVYRHICSRNIWSGYFVFDCYLTNFRFLSDVTESFIAIA